MSPVQFSPLVDDWFRSRYGRPTSIQALAWARVASGEHLLISSDTGSGKSLAAWLPMVDRLVVDHGASESLERCGSSRRLRVLYISPLRALSRDMAAGVVDCLDGLAALTDRGRVREWQLRVGLRTGDTSASERASQRRKPPDILMTTPESLFVLLGSSGGRSLLADVESVIVDEVHALVGNKRGAHLSLSLERLECLAGRRVQRIGLSATARPLRLVAGFLVGAGRGCGIVSAARAQPPEVRLELPDLPLGHFAHGGHWAWISQRLRELATQPGTMLVFCNTRGMVERVAGLLAEQLDDDQVAAHHGSIGRKRRQEVESGLKSGRLKVVVCSASLELGIDVGSLDRVCQLGACGAINAYRQRAGRSRHQPDARPCIHAFALSLSDLLEFAALDQALEQGRLDRATSSRKPLDVLAQQVVAMVAAGESEAERIHAVVTRALPWRKLSRDEFNSVVDMLHDGYVPGRETGSGPIHRCGSDRLAPAEQVDKRSLLNAGTIPEWFDQEVIDINTSRVLGRLDEDFAFESSPGQILQLGGQSWRIIRILTGQVMVESAPDEVPNLPFWFGEGPGRTSVLSRCVQSLCCGVSAPACPVNAQLAHWLDDSRTQLGKLPGPARIVLERFFDPGGDQHLVIHSMFGAAINRAWGLALRKRFCRSFNFELQAAAIDNGVLISLGAVHSFDLGEVTGWIKSASIEDLLTQALLDTPIFQARLRWCANTALAIERRDFKGRVPPQIQRNQAENLIARIFPDQLACLENLSGQRRIPDHPLVKQALKDCLEDFMDLPGLIRLYQAIEAGRIEVHAIDTPEPSGLAMALIHAPRHSFLDPAAAEERRTRSFESRGLARKPMSAAARPSLNQVSAGTGPASGSARPISGAGLERSLITAGYLLAGEGAAEGVSTVFMRLVRSCQAVSFQPDSQRRFWVHVERLAEMRALWPKAAIKPFLASDLLPEPLSDKDEALRRLVLGRTRWLGQLDIDRMATETGLAVTQLQLAAEYLKQEGLLAHPQPEEQRLWTIRQPRYREA